MPRPKKKQLAKKSSNRRSSERKTEKKPPENSKGQSIYLQLQRLQERNADIEALSSIDSPSSAELAQLETEFALTYLMTRYRRFEKRFQAQQPDGIFRLKKRDWSNVKKFAEIVLSYLRFLSEDYGRCKHGDSIIDIAEDGRKLLFFSQDKSFPSFVEFLKWDEDSLSMFDLGNERKEPVPEAREPHTEIEYKILGALKNVPLQAKQLLEKIGKGSSSEQWLNKLVGPKSPLRMKGPVRHKRGLGFYREDFPPEDL
jgi:hypothetical protein